MVDKMIQKYLNQKVLPRTASALILAPIILFACYKGGIIFNSIIIILAIMMGIEWVRIINSKAKKFQKNWLLLGLIYIGLPCLSLIYLRNLNDGFLIILMLLSTVWASDIGGYLVGIAIGGPKLLPMISPSKTWSGFLGSIIFSSLVGLFFVFFTNKYSFNWIIMSCIISIIAQTGDLLESSFKRHFNVKDSGNIIPGHGGVLDRVDSIVTASSFLAIYNLITNSL
jgi:phosphatidate cytidylyltransferase